ncbi:PREDICTED: uncharacterized protein LOC105367797 [Ceratosolen solmsi marchali]|uniref:Beta-sarcoglycan n=1 Tax=Ceratosolen solmsi marchali TaxID=326594 RepID=A0AAJ7E200_9HYME|nr:PREDICTED: uncharacterized protein LOC105367797 [Ceratosolen solmsi marchali]
MTNLYDQHRSNEEASPSFSRTAEDNLSNSDGPLIVVKKRDKDFKPPRQPMYSSGKLLQQDSWYKSRDTNDSQCSKDEKTSHQCVWMLTLLLAVIGFCNLLLNFTILIVLRVSQGMEAFEVIPEQDLVKFYGNTDLDRVCLHRGICEGFGDEPIELIGDGGGVHIQVANRQHSMAWSNLQILKNGTSISQIESFQIKDPRSGSPIFSTEFPNFGLPQGVQKIEVGVTQTHRIAAPKKSDLSIISDDSIFLHGAEGTSFDSKNIIWTAKNDIFLRSRNGDIVIDAKDNINLPQIPIASAFLPSPSNDVQDQYKVCVCMPDGKLFLVPMHKGITKINCAKISRSMDSDPCAI